MSELGDAAKLGVKAAAARAGVHEKTVRRAISRGDLRAFRPRGQRALVLLVDDVDDWALVPVTPEQRNERPNLTPVPSPRSRGRDRAGSVTRLRGIERGEV